MAQVGYAILGSAMLAQAGGAGGASGIGFDHVLWALILLGMAVVLFFAELFVPTGGVLGVAAALCLIGGIICLFWIDTTYGIIGIVVTMLALPFAFALGLWIWPSTPIAKAMMLGSEDDEDELETDGQAVRDIPTHESQISVGVEGKSLTELRPVGTCLLDGKRQECLSVSGLIEVGERVKVVNADGMQIKVKRV